MTTYKTVLKTLTDSFARPANTTAYAAGDGVTDSTSAPTPLSYSGATSAFRPATKLISARLVKSGTSTTSATFRLWLYKGAVSNVPNDNAAFAPAEADQGDLIGSIAFGTAVAGSDCVTYIGTLSGDLRFNATSDNVIYGILEATGAYTPESAETFYTELVVEQY